MPSQYEPPYFQTCDGDEEESLGPRHCVKVNITPSAAPKAIPKPVSVVPHPITPKCIIEPILKQALDKWLPKPSNHIPTKRVLRDAIFPRIQELLMQYGKREWSYLPRTFAVLQMLGYPEALDYFVAQKRSDSFLPYNASNLPDIIHGALRAKFLKLQQMVLCRQKDVLSLEDGGKHVHLNGPGDNYFEFIEKLGRGTYGTVDRVRSRQTLKQYARKLIHRGASVASDSRMYRQFEGEIQALKNLSHPHIVKLVGSYTDEDHLGLIMTPIADMNLNEYLTYPNQNPLLRKRTLPEYFGCLATALAYLHQEGVRHNDIKPRNVLLKNSRVYLADFGTSRRWGAEEASTTIGAHEGYTPRYSAPETHDTNSPRNRASDMWSLGCVFLEMATVLMDRTLEDLDRFLGQNGTLRVDAFWTNPEATLLWIEELRKTSTRNVEGGMLGWTKALLQVVPADRPTAAQLRGWIVEHKGQDIFICHWCSSEHGLRPQESGIVSADLPAEETSEESSGELEMLDAKGAVGFALECEPPVKDTTNSDTILENAVVEDVEGDGGSGTVTPTNLETSLIQKGTHFGSQEDVNAAAKMSDDPPPYEPITPLLRRRPQPAAANEEKRFVLLSRGPATKQLPKGEAVEEETEEVGAADEEFLRLKPLAKETEPHSFNEEFIRPAPVNPPSFLHPSPIPKSTLVPSYILAGTNRFSKSEISAPPDGTAINLFVYGRLMFPGVLSAIAAQSTEGVYSFKLRRRLLPTSEDWAKADLSIRRASEIMTPARLVGYDRWRPRGLNCAAVASGDSALSTKIDRIRRANGQSLKDSEPPGHVEGFLILGLHPEAIRYCDLLFGSSRRTMHTLRPQDDPDRDEAGSDSESDPSHHPRSLMERRAVSVQVETSSGDISTVVAETYVWAGCTYELTNLWEEERFLRSAPMQKILDAQPNWEKQEREIATSIKTSFALVGDYFLAPIQAGENAELKRLLDENMNPDAVCRLYGYPLQAAAAFGRVDMVRMLLDYGTKVNAVGGQYGSALIAATCTSRKAITKLLLRNGANVFASDSLHVNALYQAIANGDYAMAEILLDHGAWLGQDWYETRDMADERGDEDLKTLLDGYDVRKIYHEHLAASWSRPDDRERERGYHSAGNDGGTWDGVKYSKVILAVLRKIAALQGVSGSWRGEKGAAVVVAALDAGAPLKLIGMLRSAVAPVQAVLEILRKGDEEQERKRLTGERCDMTDRQGQQWEPGERRGGDCIGRSTQRRSSRREKRHTGLENVECGSHGPRYGGYPQKAELGHQGREPASGPSQTKQIMLPT